MNFEVFLSLFVLGLSAVLFLLQIWYQGRDERAYEGLKVNRVFYCAQCSYLYAGRVRDKAVCCPNCSSENSVLSF